jgi:hypothetical protein
MKRAIDAILALELETTFASSHYEFSETMQSGEAFPIGSGFAFYAGQDSPFTQVVGWGFGISDSEQLQHQLSEIENFYLQRHAMGVAIELSPLVGTQVARLLTDTGYAIAEFSDIACMELSQWQAQAPGQDKASIVVAKIVGAKELELWAQTVASGFSAPELAQTFIQYANGDHCHAFGAYLDGILCGGGTMAMHHGVCDLGITSTLMDFRGRGLQTALLQARLHFAKEQGATLAAVATDPGSTSCKNVHKAGFETCYTRIKFEKPL